MSAKAIREYDGKRLLGKYLQNDQQLFHTSSKSVHVHAGTTLSQLPTEHPWLLTDKLVVKPDQLIKRRGKSGLLLLNATWDETRQWIEKYMNQDVTISPTLHGVLRHFIIEPFIPHTPSDEYYVCVHSVENGEEILFYHEGGVDVGDVDAKSERYTVPVGQRVTAAQVDTHLLKHVPASRRPVLAAFIESLFRVYDDLFFTYLEINPVVVVGHQLYYLDFAAKLDQTAEFQCAAKWGPVTFPPPFGRELTPEEACIADMDAKTGASLKLTLLNPRGRIWTMVAGGGASVAYSDAIANLGFAHELANYGEYSGAPNEMETYVYAKTVIDLMTREVRPEGKLLIIGGGIANFTNVAATFKGIVRALKEFQARLIECKVHIYVRRGGPNYQEGLKMMSELGEQLGVPIRVYGPETHVTGVVPIALGTALPIKPSVLPAETAASLPRTGSMPWGDTHSESPSTSGTPRPSFTRHAAEELANMAAAASHEPHVATSTAAASDAVPLFTSASRAFVYGLQPRAVQGMLDFDVACRRKTPSVAAMIYPFQEDHLQKFYWGTEEILIPVYQTVDRAMKKFPLVDCVVNFASCRSVYESTMQFLQYDQVRTIAIIAEGVPEKHAKVLRKAALSRSVTLIGPATVGGIKPGCFKIGNTGGMMDNIVASQLYRPGSVAYVSKSGGMSNELNHIVAMTTDGVAEGIAIGGDRFPGSTFIDHVMRYQRDPQVKLIVLLGEVGGLEEYKIVDALQQQRITKPLVAWCMGTCASLFASEVQFGHAGACANSDMETATAKNAALKKAGALVPATFEELPALLQSVFMGLVERGQATLTHCNGTATAGNSTPTTTTATGEYVPKVPVDYAWASELGLIRRPSHFVSSICDDRGSELLYAGIPITEVMKQDMGVGGVLGLLWFRKTLPAYARQFLEMALMLTADHGPAVSGAHNTIVAARAGKDLVSSLCSGLLTIGDRFGGALDGAARQFSEAFYEESLTPAQFVEKMRKRHELIMGIGHKIKSKHNPDRRVEMLVKVAKETFPKTPLLSYALEVEKLTTMKKDNLILNVDGTIAVCMVDMLRDEACFTKEEANEYIKTGVLNGLFVLGRTMGFIGHWIDQHRFKQGLYRHPWDDITYVNPQQQEF